MNRKKPALIALVLVLGIALVRAQKGEVAPSDITRLQSQAGFLDCVAITPMGAAKGTKAIKLNVEIGGTSEYATGVDISRNPC